MANFISDYTGDEIEGRLDYLNLDSNYKVYKSLIFANGDLATGNTAPASLKVGTCSCWSYDINDDSKITLKTPLDMDVTEDITVKIRWGINEAYATGSGEVQWNVLTYYEAVGQVLDAGDDQESDDTGDINIPATANTIVETDITLSASNITAGDTIGMKVSRIAIDGGSDPTADPYIISLELVYQSNYVGESI